MNRYGNPCSDCGETDPSEFTKSDCYCKTCRGLRTRRWNERNPEKRAKAQSRYYKRVGEDLRMERWNRRNRLGVTLRTMVASARDRAKKKEWPISITEDELFDMWREQGGRCALSGVVLKPSARRGTNPQNVFSLDRIANNGTGYTKENCRLVSVSVNAMRQNGNDETVLAIARGIVETIG